MPTFVAGLELNRRFYEQVVYPILNASFPRLPYAAALIGPGQAQMSSTWSEREKFLIQTYETLAHMHNSLEVSEKLPELASSFYDRPFQTIHSEVFAQALVKQITDLEIQQIARRQLIGNINQWSDNTDIEGLERGRLRQLYE